MMGFEAAKGMDQSQYRITEIQDEVSIDQIIRACDRAFPNPVASRENYPELLAKICQYAVFLTAQDREPLGYAAMYANNTESKIAFITLLAVKPEKQGMRIGRNLLEACLERARQCGMHNVQLEVRKENVKAIGLYQAAGFRKQDKETNTSIFMIKAL